MPRTEIDLNPVDFITIGTIGPRGQRVFHLQAGHEHKLISFTMEKEQAWALSDAIREMLDNLDERFEETTEVELAGLDMDLREPIQPLFRIAQMGLAYEEESGLIILVVQELVPQNDDEEEEESEDAGVVRMWCSREQMRALSLHAAETVAQGRPDPKMNGRITYYWT